MADLNIRTRFAPSPTGHLHIGNARTAIMNWVFARHSGGTFVLRIEDTDRERSTAASEKSILEDLRWLGLEWDEGPDKEGKYGPYRQSEREGLYRETLTLLMDRGKVYPCYCSAEELEAGRKDMLARGLPPHYSGKCRNYDAARRRAMEAEGRVPSYRFKIETGDVRFTDLVKGDIAFETVNMGDFIVVRPDGMPMYNYACVVDDHLMEISHVIRGDDHVSNTPRQVLLYEALGWHVPRFAHIPMILGRDRVRLSKRHGATSVDQYRERGYLPDALFNFLSLLSWSPENGEEILSRGQIVDAFDFSRVSRSPSVFDVEKLDWMNGVYIRSMTTESLTRHALPFFKEAGFPVASEADIAPVMEVLHEKLERLSDIREKASFFFEDPPGPEDNETAALMNSEDARKVYRAFVSELGNTDSWDGSVFSQVMKAVQKETGIRGKDLWMPVRVALTGRTHGPELPGIVEIFGPDKVRRLMMRALKE